MSRYSGILRLALLLVIAPLLLWRLAISPTVGMWSDYRRDAVQIAAIEQSGIQQREPVATKAAVELIQSGLLLEQLLPALAGKDAAVEKYTPFVTSDQTETSIHTAEITLRGGYLDLVKTISFMEQNIPECRISSAAFNSYQNQNKETKLHVAILIEQLIIKEV